MAFNKFIGRSRQWLETTREAVQDALVTGQPTKVVIAGVTSEFDPGRQNLNQLLTDIQYSISQLDDASLDDPKDVNPYAQRVMHAETRFS